MTTPLDALAATEARRPKRRTPLGARTLALYRREGWLIEKVEQRIPGTPITKDVFTIFDAIAVHPNHQGVLGIQWTTSAHLADRKAKVEAAAVLPTWLAAGNRVEVIGWRKVQGKWTARRELVALGGK